MASPHQDRPTQWPIMWIAFGGGIVAATHLGKLPPALPEIRLALDAGLVMGGWIASTISAIGFLLGLAAGTIADRIGQRRVLVAGLLLLTAGSCVGAIAQTGEAMLFSRFIEGLGYTAATVAGAGMVTHVTARGDRRWALGIWSSYVPVGFAGMLIGAAFVLETFDWRVLWLVTAAVTVLWAAAVFHVTRGWRRQESDTRDSRSLFRNITRCIGVPGALLVSVCFAAYAAQHISMMAWLPSYMHEVYGTSLLVSAVVPAVVLLFNAGGNWLSARWMGRGMSCWALLSIGALGMGLTQIGVFSSGLDDAARLAFALLFGIFGGMIPAAAVGSVTVYTPSPAQIGTMNGLMVMGTNTGMLFGPPAVAAVRAYAGNWNDVIWLVLAFASVGLICGLASRSMELRAGAREVR